MLSPSISPSMSPGPVSPKPTTFVQMNFEVSGVDQATFVSKDESAYKSILASAAKLSDPSLVDVTVVAPAPSTSTAAGRRLLQSPPQAASPILTLQNVLYTSDPTGTLANLQAAVADGSLARQLSTIGLTLNPTSVVYPSSSSSSPPSPSVSPSPSPSPSNGSGSNTGAIVGGVVGGVVGAAILIGVVVVCLRNNRKSVENKKVDQMNKSAATTAGGSGVGAGLKADGPMYTANPAFAPEDVQPPPVIVEAGAGASTSQQNRPPPPIIPPLGRKNVIDNAMFDQLGDPLTTPRPSARGTGGQNLLFDSQRSDRAGANPSQSDLSGPQSARSRMESARSGLTSNPTFALNLVDDDNDNFEDANNALYQSARSGTDIMASAESDLQLDSARTYESAQQGSVRSQTLKINPLFNSPTAAEGVNPLYEAGKQGEQPSSARRS
jgi:hypothetical protein